MVVAGTVLLLPNCSSDEDTDPPITAAEGLFINEIYASGDDWVELYNSTDHTKDISGYRIHDDGAEYQLPEGVTVAAHGFLVIYCDDLNDGLHTNFKLSSAGERVTLKNADNEVAEAVTYPKLDNGQSYGRYPDGSDDFSISGITSIGSSNNESNAPAITTVTRTPIVPAINQAVIIQAELTNIAQLSTVKLFYRFNSGSYTEAVMTKPGAYYTATIPAQGAGVTGKMEYYVEAKSTTGATSYKPFDAPGDAYYYLLNNDVLPTTTLFINEIMASSTTCCPDNDGGTNEFDDWIEIYNAGGAAIDLSGMYLSDDLADPFQFKIPNGISIPAGGFLVFWADEQGSQGPFHMNFKLSKSGETVGLFYIDGRIIDSHTFSDQNDNKSLERSTDGGSSWQQTTSPTQGTSNNP